MVGRAWLIATLIALGLIGLLVSRCRPTSEDPGSENPLATAAALGLDSAPLSSQSYTVAPGDSLGVIAARFGTTVATLMQINALGDADAIYIGQRLELRIEADRDGPAIRSIPNSELVYGPAYAGFDTAAFIITEGGRLADYSERVNGEMMRGPQIVSRIANDFSVGPRALLAFVEARSGQVSGPGDLAMADYPAGSIDPARSGLWLQLNWLADRLNGGYYDWRTRDNRLITTLDGLHLAAPKSLNAASFALQRALGFQTREDQLLDRLSEFDAAYRRLFGDPWARARDELDLGAVDFPALDLPWDAGSDWWMTGGPHGGWGDGSAWAALDFVPPGERRGCFISEDWVVAVADGIVLESADGEIWLDLDGDGDRRTGPAVQYLHLSSQDRIAAGRSVVAGERLGRPSCEGGVSTATHLHIARSYDGEWLAAAGPSKMALGRWRAYGGTSGYEGGLERRGERREACECRKEGKNDVGR